MIGGVHDAVGNHLRVDAYVALAIQEAEHRIGDATNTELQGGPVLDEVRAMAPDGALDVGGNARGELRQVTRHFDHVINFTDVQRAVAEHARHALIHERHHHLGAVAGGQAGEHLDTQAHVAVRIRRSHLHEGDIERNHPFEKQARNLMQEHGGVIGAAVVDGFSIGRSDEHRIVPEALLHAGPGEGVFAKQEDVVEAHIA
jgi:hypothetical protein